MSVSLQLSADYPSYTPFPGFAPATPRRRPAHRARHRKPARAGRLAAAAVSWCALPVLLALGAALAMLAAGHGGTVPMRPASVAQAIYPPGLVLHRHPPTRVCLFDQRTGRPHCITL